MKSRLIRNLIIGLLIVIGLTAGGLALYHSKHQPVTTPDQTAGATNEPASISSGPTANQGGSQSNKTYPVSVYFSKHPESDNEPASTFALGRSSPNLSVGNFAVTQLLQGPAASETAQGYFSMTKLRSGTSTCGGADFNLTISGSVATLQFCKPFDHLGVVADGQAQSEITDTLKQFSSVTKVVILNSAGDCEFNLSGQNLCKQ